MILKPDKLDIDYDEKREMSSTFQSKSRRKLMTPSSLRKEL